MAGTGGQDRDITRVKLEFLAVIAAEANARMAAGNAERLVDRGVIVQVVVDAVVPTIAPAVRAEQAFDNFLGIAVAEVDRALVDQERQGIIRHQAIVGKDEGGWLEFHANSRQNEAPWSWAGSTPAAAPRSRQVCPAAAVTFPWRRGPESGTPDRSSWHAPAGGLWNRRCG